MSTPSGDETRGSHSIRRRSIRAGVLFILCAAAVLGARHWQASRRPQPAPTPVQVTGMKLVREALTQVQASVLGPTERYTQLAQRVTQLIDQDRLIFTPDIAHAGYTLRQPDGQVWLYVKVVLAANGGFEHQPLHMIGDTVFHEAVHSLQRGPVSIEEECDGYEAGLSAGAILLGSAKPPERLRVEGQSIFAYVQAHYPHLPRRDDYQPVGLNLERLRQRAELPGG